MIHRFISYVADFSVLIPVVFALLVLKKSTIAHLEKANKLILGFVLLTLLRNVLTTILAQIGVFNIYIYNWYNLISFVLVAILYYLTFQNRYFKGLALLLLFVSIFIACLDLPSLVDVKTVSFNNFSYHASGSFTILLILIYYFELLKYLTEPKLGSSPLFWFSSGALFYYSGTIFSYIFINNTFNNLASRDQYWVVDALLSVVLNIFLTFSVWYMKPRPS